MTDKLSKSPAGRLGRRLSSATTIVALALMVWAGTGFTAAAKVMQAPGSRVSLDLPENFKASPLFAGFMEIISSAAVLTLEMPPEAYDKVVAGFTAEALAKKGIAKVEVGTLKRDDSYLFVTGEQDHPRAVFAKFILVIRDPRNTAVITFNVPKGSLTNGSIKRENVIKALTTAKLEAKAAPSKDLFKLGYLGSFELSGKVTGTSRLYTLKDDKGPKATRNLIVIAPSLNRLPIRDLQEFSQYALKSLKNTKDLAIRNAKDFRIDDMKGHQITAVAKRGKGDTPFVIRQLVLLPSKGGYFRLLSVTRMADEERLAPEIEKIFASFKATDSEAAQ
ncbi:MAG: hypothetical protein ACR2PI_28230 [Hyphomicrobiaceae bacterium]